MGRSGRPMSEARARSQLRFRPGRLAAQGALLVVGLCIGKLMLDWLLRDISLPAVWRIARGLPGWLLPAMVLCELSFHAAKARRWQILQAQPGRSGARFRDALSAQAVGGVANMVLPLRADDLARTAVLARRLGRPLLEVAGATALDRTIDLICLGTLGVFVLPHMVVRHAGLTGSLRWLLVVAPPLAAVAGLASLEWVVARLARAQARWGRVLAKRLEELLSAARALRQGLTPRRAGALLLALCVEWGAMFTMFGMAARALLPELGGPLVPRLVLANYAAFLVPGLPGAVGVFEGALLSQLGDADPTRAAALVLLLHVVLLVPLATLGSLCGVRELLSPPVSSPRAS